MENRNKQPDLPRRRLARRFLPEVSLGFDHTWIIAALLFLGVIASLSPLVPHDFWWHLKAGEMIAVNHIIKEVHEKLKDLRKGDKVEICRRAEAKGSKVVTTFEVKVLQSNHTEPISDKYPITDNYFDVMLASYRDSLQIQEKLGTMIDTTKISICLFIARTKINGSNFS